MSGQDGSYLSEHLVELGYEVHGIVRRNSTPEHQENRLHHLQGQIHTYYGDVLDPTSLERLLQDIQPDEVYNLAAQSHVRVSFDIPQFTIKTNALGLVNVLEAVKRHCPEAHVYQASSSEMFGNSVDDDKAQRETTPMRPTSPYGCAKLFAYSMMRHYRNAYNMFAANGILFNHESPRRGSNFVTSKVVKAACMIKLGRQDQLELGNMDTFRDWGHSKDYVRAMRLILNHHEPDDFVVATGETHSIRELCDHVFSSLGMNYLDYVVQNPKFMRPEELQYLRGDSSRAREILGWEPEHTFETLLDDMTSSWMDILK
jgi:GDPmannose 4,6-dehydratase